jgi:hypothetical protein
MQLVDRVTSAQAFSYDDGFSNSFILIGALGEVGTSGWTRFRLVPRAYGVVPPANGIWDIDLVGDEPSGTVLQVVVPVSVFDVFFRPSWVRGVEVHVLANSAGANVSAKTAASVGQFVPTSRVVYRKDLASFDDSIQPTGTIHWHGLTPHIEMKKLHHTLTLVVEGPDMGTIDNCFHQAATAAIIAAIIAAYATGGLGLGAALDAFVSALTACLGSSHRARIENHSHWVYWDT